MNESGPLLYELVKRGKTIKESLVHQENYSFFPSFTKINKYKTRFERLYNKECGRRVFDSGTQ